MYEDTRPLSTQKLHADVAAYEPGPGKKELRIVVEVLATPPRLDHMIRKINTFAAEHTPVPTAWVLLLDHFFGDRVVGGVKRTADLSKAGRMNYTVEPIEPGEMDNFVVTGAENKTFSFLLDQYGYAVGVFLPGYVFLIRRDYTNEEQRHLKLLRGESWNASDDVYMITRIADKDIVRTLLHTPVLQFQQEVPTSSKLPPGTPKDLPDSDHHWFDMEDVLPAASEIIDFEAYKLDGEEAELAYDPLQLILDSREARERARQRYEKEMAEEAKQQEAEAAREMQRLQADQQAEEQAQRDQQAAEDERIAARSAVPEEVRRIHAFNNANEDHEKGLIHEDAEWPWQPTRHRMQAEQRQWIKAEALRKGYIMPRPEQMYLLSEADGLRILQAIRDQTIRDSPVELEFNHDSIARAYAKLDAAGRLELERHLFPGGTHDLWFFTIMEQQNKKDIAEKKKQEAQRRREEREQRERENQLDQLRMDFD